MRKEVTFLLPEDIVSYLKQKFQSKEEVSAFISKLIRGEMRSSEQPKICSLRYRWMKERVKEISDAGKEITAKALTAAVIENGQPCSDDLARDWLRRMVKDKYVKEVKRRKTREKVYALR